VTTGTEHRRRGRPPGTSPRELELIALRLFTEQGFDETTVDEIAAAAGVSSRTFFRYFDTKADVLWHAFDAEVAALREALAAVPDGIPLMDGIRTAVVAVNRYTADDMPELRARMNLIGSVPSLRASAVVHYDAWEQVVIDYAAQRLRAPCTSLLPLAVGRATLAVCRAAYEYWVASADADLTVYLDEAIGAMASGFRGPAQPSGPDTGSRPPNRSSGRKRRAPSE
jgi:mycofactocin system transcriptional regulator